MALITRFETTDAIRDLPEDSEFYENWHKEIDSLLADGRQGSDGIGEFYNPARKDFEPVAERFMNWTGFPRTLLTAKRDNRQKAFEAAEKRRDKEAIQGEYFEWFATRGGDGKIRKVTFTTETRLYWTQLFKADRNRVLELYRELVSPEVQPADLVDADDNYNSYNVWNTEKGIVHYIVGINHLGAALDVSQDGVDLVKPHAVDNYDFQTRAEKFPEFAADSRMGFDVGIFARKNFPVTFRDPINLYITDWDDTGWTKPDGSPVGNYWRIVRGKPGMALRLEYEVPESEGFLVGDISIGGRPIEYGGHLAEHITVMIATVVGNPA